MSNEILYVFLPDYAAHEAVYLSQAVASDDFALKTNPKYVNRVVAPTMDAVRSIGGFRTIPDYSFDTMPDDYDGLLLSLKNLCLSSGKLWRMAVLSVPYAMPLLSWLNMVS